MNTSRTAADLWERLAGTYERHAAKAKTPAEREKYEAKAVQALSKSATFLKANSDAVPTENPAHQSCERCPLHDCPVTRPLV